MTGFSLEIHRSLFVRGVDKFRPHDVIVVRAFVQN